MKDRLKRISEIQEEINFKELFTNPARLFGYTYFYFLIVLVGLGIYFVQHLNEINKNTIPPFVVTDSLNGKKDISFALPVEIPPVDVFKLSEPTPDLLEKGKAFYNTNCSSCHGETGKGDGPAGLVMNPKPRNFTLKDGWINGRKISEIYKTLQEGILKSGMPAYNHVNPEELFAVIHYVRTFAPDFPKDTQSDLQALNDTYKLSQGKKSAGQIPTSKSLTLIVNENSEKSLIYYGIIELLNQTTPYNSLIISKEKFAGFLVNVITAKMNETEFFNILKINPVHYGLSPRINFLNEQDKKNFYDYFVSYNYKKV